MPPLPKKPKLNVNGTSAKAAAPAAAGVADDRIAEQPHSNADDGITEDLLRDDSENNDPTIHGMSKNLTAGILGFLGYKDIMRSRICCRKFRDAARTTIVPWTDGKSYDSRVRENLFRVDSVQKHKALVAMSTALPNLQQISLYNIGHGHKYQDGKDPVKEEAASTADWNTHEIDMISKFSMFRRLTICVAPLNGRYPVLFNYPLLKRLDISYCDCLKWDLNALTKLHCLKELNVDTSNSLTGNINSLRVLKATLEKVHIRNCKIEGDFMDLADFPRLKSVALYYCSGVTGDVREIGENDFPVLESLMLGEGAISSTRHEFQRIADVPSAAGAIYRLNRRDPPLIRSLDNFCWSLSCDSPEWYAKNGKAGHPSPPLFVNFVRAGSRVGWRWKANVRYNQISNSCEINWLDPEPGRESNDYDVYIRELQSIQEDIFCFEGYRQPPSQDEYKRLCDEYYGI